MNRITIGSAYTTGPDGIVTTEALSRALLGYRGAGFVPPGVRMVGPGGTWWVLERPAGPILVASEGVTLKLPMPWTVFIVGTRIRAFVRPASLSRPDDELFHLPLPGVAENGTLPWKAKAGRTRLESVLANYSAALWAGPVLHPPTGHDPDTWLQAWAAVPSLAAACAMPWVPATRLDEVVDTTPHPVDLGELVKEVTSNGG